MAVTVTVTEPAGFTLDDVAKQIAAYKKLDATVGFGATMHPDAMVSVATIAAVHEFGRADRTIPERSFIRSALRLHQKEIANAMVQGLGRVIVGEMSAVESMVVVAKLVGSFVLARMDDAASWAVPLEQATVDAKGHAFPLVDSFYMREHLEWEVRRNGRFVRRGRVL